MVSVLYTATMTMTRLRDTAPLDVILRFESENDPDDR